MRSLSAVKLKDVSAGSVDTQAAEAKAPTIVLYYSSAAVMQGGKKKPTPQAKLSADVLGLFGGKSARVGVLARLFTLLKVNVTSVTPKDDKLFNGMTAPVVLVKASDGSKVGMLRGKVSEGALVAAMAKALQKDKINGARIAAKGVEVLNLIRKLVDERDRLRKNLAQLTARMKRDKGSKAKLLQQRVTQTQAELDKVQKALDEAYGKLKELHASA
jgi:hypothetical protein